MEGEVMEIPETSVHSLSFSTKIGVLTICEKSGAISSVSLGKNRKGQEDSHLLLEAKGQFEAYLSGRLKEFTLPLQLEGTDFQKKVWQAILQIPYGQTRSYREVAEMVGNGKACRAVGMAAHQNPLLILVPCHRVIGSDGGLTGYGAGLEVKQKLLLLEQKGWDLNEV